MRPILHPLGDRAVLAYLPDEAAALDFAEAVRSAGLPWLIEVVPAYSTAGVYFDPERIGLSAVREALAELRPAPRPAVVGKTHVLPCCYELQLDLDRVAKYTGLPADTIIEKHTSQSYTVHAIGFCPGFPYLGYLPPELTGVPRLASPRLRVEPGSVGLTGRQTGLYPLARPGGWNLIGRAPLTLVDVADGYFPLRVGDRVRFQRIDRRDYDRLTGERLPT